MFSSATEEDPLTQGSHDLVDACHVFGDQPCGGPIFLLYKKQRPYLILKLGDAIKGDKISILCGQMPPFRGKRLQPNF